MESSLPPSGSVPRQGLVLPPPNDDIELIEPLEILERGWPALFWSAQSKELPGVPLVAEFGRDLPVPDEGNVRTKPRRVRTGPRFPLDLDGAFTEEGFQTAIVTALPAPLPHPFEHFSLIGYIGRGGMGQVWAAESRAPMYRHTSLAIKFLNLLGDDWDGIREVAFEREALAGFGINHHAIVPTRDLLLWRPPAKYWPNAALVMDRHEPSLEQVIKDLIRTDSRLSQEQAVQIARDVLTAMEELEARRVVHRDLKPSNILLKLEGEQSRSTFNWDDNAPCCYYGSDPPGDSWAPKPCCRTWVRSAASGWFPSSRSTRTAGRPPSSTRRARCPVPVRAPDTEKGSLRRPVRGHVRIR